MTSGVYIKTEEHKEKLRKLRIGKKCSEETKLKMSLSKKGVRKPIRTSEHIKKLSMARRGKKDLKGSETKKRLYKEGKLVNPNRGKKMSEEQKKNISKSMKGKPSKLNLEKHPNWRGGKSFEPYGIDFNKQLKLKIRKRDNYRCQECFRHQDELFLKCKDGKVIKYSLDIHHIDFNKKNNNESNLLSLCRPCHMQTFFDESKWIKYYQEKVIKL